MTSTGSRALRPRTMLAAGALLATTGVAWTVAACGPPPDPLASAIVQATPVLVAFAIIAGWRHAAGVRRDGEAHGRLQLLRDRTCVPDVYLLAVVISVWATPAGQVADAVDIATGGSGRVWFPLTTLPVGAFVLLHYQPDQVQVLDWMPAAEVQAAQRHRARRCR